MEKPKVLCIESDPDNLKVLKCLLETQGFLVIPAATGEQALDLIAGQPIDGVLLEYELLDACSMTLHWKMKRIKPEVPILLFAGVGDHTPMLIRFFDGYLRDSSLSDDVPRNLVD